MIPRGIRNCNAGNIRRNSTKWQGLRKEQTDKAFFQFISMEYGYRALAKTLITYYTKYKLKTIKDIINRYAPPVENNTSSYVKHVSQQMQVPSTMEINVKDKNTLIALCAAICKCENGVGANLEEVTRGVEMALV